MRKITLFIGALLVSFAAYAGFGAYQGTTSLGVFGYVKCSTGLTCTKVGDKLNIVSSPSITGFNSYWCNRRWNWLISGFLQKQVAATANTITAAQCGSTFTTQVQS